MSKPDIEVHGIRFFWDIDVECYVAQVTPQQINDVFDDAWEQAQELYSNEWGDL